MEATDPDARLLAVRSRSRPRSSRNSSVNSVPYLPLGPEALIFPEGPVSEEAVELLQDFVHPYRRGLGRERSTGEAVVGRQEQDGREAQAGSPEGQGSSNNDGEEDEDLKQRPWYKRASPWW